MSMNSRMIEESRTALFFCSMVGILLEEVRSKEVEEEEDHGETIDRVLTLLSVCFQQHMWLLCLDAFSHDFSIFSADAMRVLDAIGSFLP